MNAWGEKAGRFVAGLGMGTLLVTLVPSLPGSWPQMGGTSLVRADDSSDKDALLAKSHDILVFVDESGSTGPQFDVYRRAILDRIVPALRAGDRLRVAPITDDDSLVSSFMAEGNLPARAGFNSMGDNEIEYKKKKKKSQAVDAQIRDSLMTELTKKLKKPGVSKYTDLFGSARMAAQLFSADKRIPVLVFLSDMQEDRGRFRFKDMKWDEKDLERIQKTYGFPDLRNVCVYVVGTRSPSIEKTRKMVKFWIEYFNKSGATIDGSHVGSMLANWPPESDCGSPRFDLVKKKGVTSWLERLRSKL